MTRPVHLPGWGVGTITESPSPAACATPLEARDGSPGNPPSGLPLKQPSASGAGEAPGLAVTTR